MTTGKTITQGALEENPPIIFLTVSQCSKKHPAFSEGGLRHLIFNADKFKFNSVIIRVGRKVLIDEQRFIEWLRREQA